VTALAALAALAILGCVPCFACGCNRRDDAPAPAGSVAQVPTAVPACARPAASIPWPEEFPLPAFAVASAIEPWAEGRMLHGVAPGSMREVVTALVRDLPRAGFRVVESEVERDDAEVEYEGKATHGKIALRPVPGCPGASEIRITATR
jgi:hypothetical protein